MMATILKEVNPAKESERFEPDAVAHYNWILGDLNQRFKSTYTEHIS